MPDLEQLRFPVGRFERLTAPLDAAARRAHIDTLEERRPGSARWSKDGRTGSSTRRIVRRAGPSARSYTTCPTAT